MPMPVTEIIGFKTDALTCVCPPAIASPRRRQSFDNSSIIFRNLISRKFVGRTMLHCMQTGLPPLTHILFATV